MLLTRLVGLGVLVIGGCATAPRSSGSGMSSVAAGPPVSEVMLVKSDGTIRSAPRGCLAQSRYTEGDLTKIVRLRDEGESLKAVAAEVGGSRQEVKCAERSMHQSRASARWVQNR